MRGACVCRVASDRRVTVNVSLHVCACTRVAPMPYVVMLLRTRDCSTNIIVEWELEVAVPAMDASNSVGCSARTMRYLPQTS